MRTRFAVGVVLILLTGVRQKLIRRSDFDLNLWGADGPPFVLDHRLRDSQHAILPPDPPQLAKKVRKDELRHQPSGEVPTTRTGLCASDPPG